MSTLPLFRPDPPRVIKPDRSRTDPVVWIRRLHILSDLHPEPEHVVRVITLRRGLNILWAPTKPATTPTVLYQQGSVTGHTAGKSTFCRLLRYALGEPAFGTDDARQRIRQRYPSGWVVAEVFVEGAPWIVARPLGVGAHPFVIRTERYESVFEEHAERLKLSVLEDALHGAAASRLLSTRFPSNDETVRWDHILPWLTRDQECRFADYLMWRDSKSESQTPELKAEDRSYLVRSVLGLVSAEETDEQRNNATLVAEREQVTRSIPMLQYHADVDHRRVQDLLGMPDLPAPSSGLFRYQARPVVERRREELEARRAKLDADGRRAACQKAMEEAIGREALARRDLKVVSDHLTIEQTALDQLIAKEEGRQQESLLDALPPASDVCGVPLKLAHARGCPFASVPPVHQLSEARTARQAKGDVREQRALVVALAKECERLRDVHTTSQKDTARARKELFAAESDHLEQAKEIADELGKVKQAEWLIERAEDAWKKLNESLERRTALGTAIDQSYRQQEAIRESQNRLLSSLSRAFDDVVRALLGTDVSGSIKLSGRNLSSRIDYKGDRNSAAIATLKLLAFDLAVLTESIEGRGAFPRFMIHDGPREADMDPVVYERFFLYLRSIEESFGAREPSFQSIVTTTTPPPAQLQGAPWLILTLDASRADGRLLGADL